MKSFLLALIFCCCLHHAQACTCFLLRHENHYYFGRNYDWITGNGLMMTNARQVKKISAADSLLTWASKYGSITFNQYGKEFPTGGMNEKGLVVELMWLDGTRYPDPDQRQVLGVLQWIQYQLDNSATVADVLQTDNNIRIGTNNTPLHYLVADAHGDAATIEFLNGHMVVHTGAALPYPVLANSDYAASREALLRYRQNKEAVSDPSLQRFTKACSMIDSFVLLKKSDPLQHAFLMLKEVAQPNTQWSIVYDLQKKEIHFFTAGASAIKTVSMKNFDLGCAGPALAVELEHQQKGNIDQAFTGLNYKRNQKLVETSVQQSRQVIEIPDSDMKKTLAFYKEPDCSTGK